jgi:hypothetical protein
VQGNATGVGRQSLHDRVRLVLVQPPGDLQLVRERGVDHRPEEEFAEFYRSAKDGCLRAVYAGCGDLALAEDLTDE